MTPLALSEAQVVHERVTAAAGYVEVMFKVIAAVKGGAGRAAFPPAVSKIVQQREFQARQIRIGGQLIGLVKVAAFCD